ncbi:MAG: hypothetical protein IJC72_00430 [Clostridia bacterium]|nr:hypothetical protein [Clostridia bacterium]
MKDQFMVYGYCSPTNGVFNINGCNYSYGEDFRSVKRYKEHKNAGFNVLLLQGGNGYHGGDWETSGGKICMEAGYKAGYDKIIIDDGRLKAMCVDDELIGGTYKDEDELLRVIEEYTKPYRDMPGFYGVQLYDEPRWAKLKSYAAVVRALKKLYPNIYLQCNLLPYCGIDLIAAETTDDYDGYKKYLDEWLTTSGSGNVTVDEYFFRRDYLMGSEGAAFNTFIIAAEACKKHNATLGLVIQSFACMSHAGLHHRHVTEPDMYFQTNLAMGFGAREIGFFTYMTKTSFILNAQSSIANDSVDGGAWINHDGSRTRLYYFGKKVLKEMQNFAPTLFKYKYNNCWFSFPKGVKHTDVLDTRRIVNPNYMDETCPIKVKNSTGVVIVTEQVAKEGSGKIFMVENVTNLKYQLEGKVQRVTIDLGALADGAKFYYRGKEVKKNVKNGVLRLVIKNGDALFIETK